MPHLTIPPELRAAFRPQAVNRFADGVMGWIALTMLKRPQRVTLGATTSSNNVRACSPLMTKGPALEEGRQRALERPASARRDIGQPVLRSAIQYIDALRQHGVT